jgi:hypothetical protein
VWLGETRLFAVLRRREESNHLLAVLDRERLVRVRCCFVEVSGLAVSPGRRFVAAGTEGGMFLFERDGTFFPVDARRPADAMAWSPGDRFLAVAGLGDVVLALRDGRLAPVTRLPIRALDLRWAASARDVVLPEGTN